MCRRLFREIVWIVFSKFKDKFIRMLLPSYLDEGILNNNHLFFDRRIKKRSYSQPTAVRKSASPNTLTPTNRS